MKKDPEDKFINLVRGVTPIKKNNKLKRKIPKVDLDLFKNKNTLIKKTHTPLPVGSEPIRKSEFSIIKNKTNKKLKKGRIKIDKKIDFHGLSLLEAENLFKTTIQESYSRNLRCLLFVTGKGVNKKNDQEDTGARLYYGKIRNNFIDWTRNSELSRFVLNVQQAGIEHGADGAFYVYLRKKRN